MYQHQQQFHVHHYHYHYHYLRYHYHRRHHHHYHHRYDHHYHHRRLLLHDPLTTMTHCHIGPYPCSSQPTSKQAHGSHQSDHLNTCLQEQSREHVEQLSRTLLHLVYPRLHVNKSPCHAIFVCLQVVSSKGTYLYQSSKLSQCVNTLYSWGNTSFAVSTVSVEPSHSHFQCATRGYCHLTKRRCF
ncbi:hypothetical protein HanXRQr2_Chr10g0459791 [Helianthus annuus]|uniref:Uncharacterized protein n=1 Tax=Helianthus annuus TaxID=4232 RepID=A0A9K3I0Y2_HELAN|nr:hypothetical protein HanXRQr2_Chr10g0459791 [Helianthus annuus]